MTARDNFDIEKEALRIISRIIDCDWVTSQAIVIDFGRRCQDAAYEKAAIDCERDGKRIAAANIRSLKTPEVRP